MNKLVQGKHVTQTDKEFAKWLEHTEALGETTVTEVKRQWLEHELNRLREENIELLARLDRLRVVKQ